MWKTETAIDIAAPVETVYQYLADFSRHPEWSTGLEKVTPVGNGSFAVGSELEATETIPARFTSRTRIIGLEPGRRIAWESWDGRTMKVQWAFELSARNGSTYLVQRAQIETTSLMGRVILAAIRKRQMPKENAQSLARIKAKLEKQ